MTREEAVKAIEELKTELLFSEEDQIPSDCIYAEQHFLAALACLDQAKSHMALAQFFEAKELTEARNRRLY